MAAVKQVEHVIASLVEERHDIAHPIVVSGRGPVLNGRGAGRLRRLLIGLDAGEINRRFLDILRIQLPPVPVRPLRITKGEVVIEQFAVDIHRPAHAGEVEDDLVLAFGFLEQSERNADGHVLPIGMLAGMEHDIRLENRHRAVGHFEGRIILPVAVVRIVLTKTDAEHIRYFENGLLAVERFKVHRKLDREAVGCIRGRRKLSLRSLRGEGALRGLRGVEQPNQRQ